MVNQPSDGQAHFIVGCWRVRSFLLLLSSLLHLLYKISLILNVFALEFIYEIIHLTQSIQPVRWWWSMIDDRWSMIDDRWSMIDDRWSMIDDRWSMIDDRWSMIDDRWSDAACLSVSSGTMIAHKRTTTASLISLSNSNDWRKVNTFWSGKASLVAHFCWSLTARTQTSVGSA